MSLNRVNLTLFVRIASLDSRARGHVADGGALHAHARPLALLVVLGPALRQLVGQLAASIYLEK